MKRSRVAGQIAPLAGGAALLLTALILREAFHVNRVVAVDIGVLVGAVVIFAIIRISRSTGGRSDSQV